MITQLLAQQPTGPEFGKSSPIGLVILVALLIGTALLIWSMNKQIKKLPETFEKDDPTPDQELDDGTDRGAIAGDAPSAKVPPAKTDET